MLHMYGMNSFCNEYSFHVQRHTLMTESLSWACVCTAFIHTCSLSQLNSSIFPSCDWESELGGSVSPFTSRHRASKAVILENMLFFFFFWLWTFYEQNGNSSCSISERQAEPTNSIWHFLAYGGWGVFLRVSFGFSAASNSSLNEVMESFSERRTLKICSSSSNLTFSVYYNNLGHLHSKPKVAPFINKK